MRPFIFRGVFNIPKSQNKKKRISPLDRETRQALMYPFFEILARGGRKFYKSSIPSMNGKNIYKSP